MEFLSKVLVATFSATGAFVLYRAVRSTSRIRGLLSLERDSLSRLFSCARRSTMATRCAKSIYAARRESTPNVAVKDTRLFFM